MAKTALEKLRAPMDARIVNELPAGAQHWGPPGATMVISTPQEIETYVAQIPKGKLATLETLRHAIARHHNTTITCPVTTGLFLNTVARAAEEQAMMGAKRVTPWWRVIRTDGSLNDKFPGGLAEHEKRLTAEGHTIERSGKTKLRVKHFDQKLARLQA
jgi:6-O-methylguanine DNA methyltransferase, DNA binding domain